MNLKRTQVDLLAASFAFVNIIAVAALVNVSSASAARLDGCDPAAPENQQIKGSAWRAKCLNGNVREVWEEICNDMTLADAKKSSKNNGCWKLMSDGRFAKQK